MNHVKKRVLLALVLVSCVPSYAVNYKDYFDKVLTNKAPLIGFTIVLGMLSYVIYACVKAVQETGEWNDQVFIRPVEPKESFIDYNKPFERMEQAFPKKAAEPRAEAQQPAEPVAEDAQKELEKLDGKMNWLSEQQLALDGF